MTAIRLNLRALAWIIHQGSTAEVQVIESTAPGPDRGSVGLLDVAMATPAEASVSTSCIFNNLRLLATNPGE